MSEKAFALNSNYVIDGVRQELTPAQILDALTEDVSNAEQPSPCEDAIVDESVDPEVRASEPEGDDVAGYLSSVLSAVRKPPLSCMDSYTRCSIASALVDAMWNRGHFRIGNLLIDARWRWNEGPVGAMAAFYESVNAAADYVDSLNLRFSRYRYVRTDGAASLVFKAVLGDDEPGDEAIVAGAARSDGAFMLNERVCPAELVPDSRSWVIYIPFDSSDYRLGGSLLAQTLGLGGAAPKIEDADYFLDCYEVVREFAEDGLLLSAATVGEGGLMAAAGRMAGNGVGVRLDISDLLRSAGETDMVKVLFSEIPGAMIQIRDSDFDYVDAELLLQDVVYFPLGHPDPSGRKVTVAASAKSRIQTILESLMLNAEGED